MNKTGKCLLLIMVLGMLMMSILSAPAMANSAEPPSLVILVINPPDDLSIALVSNEKQSEAVVRRVAWEGYYAFYSRDMQADGNYTFKAATNGESFEFTISGPLQRYNNVFTLNLSTQELTPGKYPLRSVLLVSIRLLLTLLLEGVIFMLFRFRKKRSWLVFLAVNLVTQGVLNIWLNSGGSLMPSYLIFALIIGEFFVFTAEMIALPIFIKEHKKSYILIYAFIANLISLIAGGYIISVLPV
ncbi:hypothetical protein SDC9_94614 [bioreactor metagenome]|uniref:Uncharacterized protein n=1 Tax=bioreactor metagenome TaxID=1076179 RepID=A0A645AAP4_9ZZZZ